ncbi:hypothetical protein DFH11DRAFT_1730864 [Phellopilus nigrolimitatus]|nr:hypothetical protein DFH11DRAFT_1730864 [Phellopilus nigrolimitatus]
MDAAHGETEGTSLRHRDILPTPAQSRQRTCSNNDDNGFDAASPTSHTLGGQRAMEKARAKGNGKINSRIIEQSRDVRSRRPQAFWTASVPAQNETQCTLTNNPAAESNFPKELASLYMQSRAHAQAPTPT